MRSFIVKIFSIVLMFFGVRDENDLAGYAFLLCFGTVGNYLLNAISLKSLVRFDFTQIEIKKHLKPILTFFASVVAIEIYSLVDVTMLTAMLESKYVGYYTNSTKIVKMLANTLTAMSAVLMPRLSAYFGEMNYPKIEKLSQKFLYITMTLAVPCCIGIILTADHLVSVLLGNSFEPAVVTVQILSFLIPLMPLSGGVFCQLLLTSNNEKKYLMCVMTGAVVNVILNAILIVKQRQNGAAVASVIAELVVCFMMIHLSRKIVKVNIKKCGLWSIILSSMVMAISVVGVKAACCHTNVCFRLFLEVAIGVMVYLIMLVITKNILIEMIWKNSKNRRKKKGQNANLMG